MCRHVNVRLSNKAGALGETSAGNSRHRPGTTGHVPKNCGHFLGAPAGVCTSGAYDKEYYEFPRLGRVFAPIINSSA
jgi:uncharacterized OB-fold protein